MENGIIDSDGNIKVIMYYETGTTNEKPPPNIFDCHVCFKRFRVFSTMENHYLNVHKYVVIFCGSGDKITRISCPRSKRVRIKPQTISGEANSVKFSNFQQQQSTELELPSTIKKKKERRGRPRKNNPSVLSPSNPIQIQSPSARSTTDSDDNIPLCDYKTLLHSDHNQSNDGEDHVSNEPSPDTCSNQCNPASNFNEEAERIADEMENVDVTRAEQAMDIEMEATTLAEQATAIIESEPLNKISGSLEEKLNKQDDKEEELKPLDMDPINNDEGDRIGNDKENFIVEAGSTNKPKRKRSRKIGVKTTAKTRKTSILDYLIRKGSFSDIFTTEPAVVTSTSTTSTLELESDSVAPKKKKGKPKKNPTTLPLLAITTEASSSNNLLDEIETKMTPLSKTRKSSKSSSSGTRSARYSKRLANKVIEGTTTILSSNDNKCNIANNINITTRSKMLSFDTPKYTNPAPPTTKAAISASRSLLDKLFCRTDETHHALTDTNNMIKNLSSSSSATEQNSSAIDPAIQVKTEPKDMFGTNDAIVEHKNDSINIPEAEQEELIELDDLGLLKLVDFSTIIEPEFLSQISSPSDFVSIDNIVPSVLPEPTELDVPTISITSGNKFNDEDNKLPNNSNLLTTLAETLINTEMGNNEDEEDELIEFLSRESGLGFRSSCGNNQYNGISMDLGEILDEILHDIPRVTNPEFPEQKSPTNNSEPERPKSSNEILTSVQEPQNNSDDEPYSPTCEMKTLNLDDDDDLDLSAFTELENNSKLQQNKRVLDYGKDNHDSDLEEDNNSENSDSHTTNEKVKIQKDTQKSESSHCREEEEQLYLEDNLQQNQESPTTTSSSSSLLVFDNLEGLGARISQHLESFSNLFN